MTTEFWIRMAIAVGGLSGVYGLCHVLHRIGAAYVQHWLDVSARGHEDWRQWRMTMRGHR